MTGPPDLPTVRHYADGRQVLVTTMAEFDVLEPGHADSPLGPFDEPPAADEEVVPLGDDNPRVARSLRAEGLSQQAIADRLNVSRRSVYRWLTEGEPDDDR